MPFAVVVDPKVLFGLSIALSVRVVRGLIKGYIQFPQKKVVSCKMNQRIKRRVQLYTGHDGHAGFKVRRSCNSVSSKSSVSYFHKIVKKNEIFHVVCMTPARKRA
jgi:hypothetical protein